MFFVVVFTIIAFGLIVRFAFGSSSDTAKLVLLFVLVVVLGGAMIYIGVIEPHR